MHAGLEGQKAPGSFVLAKRPEEVAATAVPAAACLEQQLGLGARETKREIDVVLRRERASTIKQRNQA